MAERITAEDLIEKKRKRNVPKIPEELLTELKKIVEYNDACVSNGAKVARDDVITMCASLGVSGMARRTLDVIASAYMGRKSFATK